MYKTIKHGDNSLQYTILPQEEGTANVKSKKSRNKGKTAAFVTITVILICGIIATAVIVPLLLTSDLVVLPAAFQKFSVSSLRKAHSGNHVVVVAKKPYGWTGHHNPVHSLDNNKTYGSNKKANKSQDETLNSPLNSTVTAAATLTTKIAEPTTERPTTVMSNEIEPNKVVDNKGAVEKNVLSVYERNKYTEQVPIERNYLDISTTTRSSKGNEFLEDKVVRISNTEIQTTSSPWYPSKWSFRHSYMRWTGNDAADNFMTIIGGSSAVILCTVVIFVVWMRRRKNLRNNEIKKSADAKADDKDTLLKESAAGSEEE